MPCLHMSHRGAHKKHVENTLEAFQTAYKLGVHIFETDVRLTKDKVPVIFHDPTLKRLCKNSHVLAHITFEDFQACSKPGVTFLSLEQLLAHFKGKKVYFNFELKVDCVEEITHILKKQDFLPEIIFSSYNIHIIQKIKEAFPSIPVGLIANFGRFLVKKAVQLKVDILIIYYWGLRKYHIDQAHQHNIAVWTWPVNTKKNLQLLEEWGIDGVMTD